MKTMKRMAAALLALILTLSMEEHAFSDRNMVHAAEAVQKIPEGYTAIYNTADLYAIRNNRSGKYILMNDIDMTIDTSQGGDYDCGTGWDSIEYFSGVLDGNGHRITGMKIFGEFLFDENADEHNIGLFEQLNDATIRNLGMIDCNIDVTIDGNDAYYHTASMGMIAGESYGRSIISNCYTEGSILCASQSTKGTSVIRMGGLLGHLDCCASIQDCFSLCEINGTGISNGEQSEKESNNIMVSHLGGICGYYGFDHSYGISGGIANSYNAGIIRGNKNAKMGGICGHVYDDYEGYSFKGYKNCQYLKDTAVSGTGNWPDSSNCVSLTKGQMKDKRVFTGYDFTDTWEIDPYCSYAYPQLKNNRMVRVKDVILKAAPSKLVYNQGETLSLEGSVLEIIYEDEIKTSVMLSPDMLDGYDMMRIGMQTVKVKYGDIETSFDIEVKEVPVFGITIPDMLTLCRAKEQRLVPVILPENASDKSVIWESSNPAVASVDSSGLVKARERGTAVISATSANGLTARCTVTVLVPAVSIQLSQTYLTLTEGESRSITAQVSPLESTDIVGWRSDNPVVAEVYNGIIMAKKAGWATITAYTDSGIQKDCLVEVNGTEKPNVSSDTNVDNTANRIRKIQATKAKIKSAKNVKKKSMKLTLSGLSGGSGYQIQYGLKKNFKGAKTITKKNRSVTIKKLKLKKTYYVRARVYKKINGNIYYGKWSGRKSVKIKK